MSINGALQTGRSALAASQAAMQVAGDNMANAATPGYHRRSVHLSSSTDTVVGRNQFVGQGVQLQEIRREVDVALQSRFHDAISKEHGAQIDQRFLTALETIQNEMTDNDLSTKLSEFFNAFSELANNPDDNAVRSLVVQEGLNVASRLGEMREEYNTLRDEIDTTLGTSVEKVNDILDQVGQINTQIAQTELGAGESGSLRDKRDALIKELSEYLDVSTVDQPNGAVDVHVGSTPIVLAGESRGIELRQTSGEGSTNVSLRVADDGTKLDPDGGRIGALMRQRNDTIQPAIDDIDTMAEQLIYQVNRLHSQGQGRIGQSQIHGTYAPENIDVTLNHPDADLPYSIEKGSFFIHVTHANSGERTSHRIDIDGDELSMNDLVDRINNDVDVPNVTASTALDGSLVLDAEEGFEISFSEDSSGALAALGMNTFFTGHNAATIDVHEKVQNNVGLVAAGSDHVEGSNGTALAIADLQDVQFSALDDRSIREFWQQSVSKLAVRTEAANEAVDSTRLVRESLDAQIQAVSGVSLDEESINLLQFQRQFQAAARFINVIDETIQTLLAIR